MMLRRSGPLPGFDRLRELFDRVGERDLKSFVEQITIIVRAVDVFDHEVLETISAEPPFEIFEEVALRGISESRVPGRRRTIHHLRIDEFRQVLFGRSSQELGAAQVSVLIAEGDRQPLAEPRLLGHLQRLSDSRALAEKGM